MAVGMGIENTTKYTCVHFCKIIDSDFDPSLEGKDSFDKSLHSPSNALYDKLQMQQAISRPEWCDAL